MDHTWYQFIIRTDDQEGFMKLREAYEAAIRFAENDSEKTKNSNNEIRYYDNDEVDAAVKAHIKKLEVIYNDIDKRRDSELWRDWLDDEVCKNDSHIDSETDSDNKASVEVAEIIIVSNYAILMNIQN